MMDPIYLLAIVRKRRDKTSKLTRIAKCSFDHEAKAGTLRIGEWWKLEIYDNPLPALMDLVFIGLSSDPGIRCAEALADRLRSGLSLASGQKWEVEACGPIDSEDAALVRIELEVV
jgi:hypothetical protein